MADTRRGHRDDSIYFDHRVGSACLDPRLQEACAGSWRGVISLGAAPDGKRIRRKVRGQSKADVKAKLAALHDELREGLHTSAGIRSEPGRAAAARTAPRPRLSRATPGSAIRFRTLTSEVLSLLDDNAAATPPGEAATMDPSEAQLKLLAAFAAAPGGSLDKLEAHQVARGVAPNARLVAALYKHDPPLLRAEGDQKVITEAGRRWLAEQPAP